MLGGLRKKGIPLIHQYMKILSVNFLKNYYDKNNSAISKAPIYVDAGFRWNIVYNNLRAYTW